jgi:hypothetical protein
MFTLWPLKNMILILMYSISRKIFYLGSTLFGLTTDNLYEFKYLYAYKTFSKFPQ